MLTKQLREMERQADVLQQREIVIKFEDVKNYIHIFSKYYVDEIIDSVEPFAMDYITHPYGFAETNEINDLDECIMELEQMFWSYYMTESKRERTKMIKEAVKKETERWKTGNAWGYGRMIGRLAYLINKKKSARKTFMDIMAENFNKK
jgi:hypothetical protein